ncbi:MAG TPA: DinB family protein [Bacteroidota bacterium]|nr:DinB family protein [Bacteroidota bacterium]
MYETIEDFIKDWRREASATLKIFRTLTNTSLEQKVCSEGRSLGFIAWHITKSIKEMGERTGLNIPAPGENIPTPNDAREIADVYLNASQALLQQVQTKWTDAALHDEMEMFGERWKRGFTLASIISHQTHHRGQMTVLMRQAGLPVPGVCGPSREEWIKWGMQPKQ